MTDPLGLAGIGFTFIFGVILIAFPKVDRRIGFAGLVIGVLILGAAAGFAIFPDGKAQSPPVVYQGPGSAYSSRQQGGVTAGTVIVGPKKRDLSHEDILKTQILTEINHDKTIALMAAVGDSEAYAFAIQIFTFMKDNGFTIKENRVISAIFMPPIDGVQKFVEPDGTIDLRVGRSTE